MFLYLLALMFSISTRVSCLGQGLATLVVDLEAIYFFAKDG